MACDALWLARGLVARGADDACKEELRANANLGALPRRPRRGRGGAPAEKWRVRGGAFGAPALGRRGPSAATAARQRAAVAPRRAPPAHRRGACVALVAARLARARRDPPRARRRKVHVAARHREAGCLSLQTRRGVSREAASARRLKQSSPPPSRAPSLAAASDSTSKVTSPSCHPIEDRVKCSPI